jgi:methionine biosynthesis protein MetW
LVAHPVSWSETPDAHADGLLAEPLDPLRYDGQDEDPAEIPGMIQAAMPRGVRVLDVGCGAGSLTVIANRNKNNQVLAIEPDPARAAAARARGLNVVADQMTDELLKAQGPFDVIVFADVLEHLAAPGALLDLAKTGLAPGGHLVASVPNVAHWTVRLKLLLGRFDYAPSGIMDATHLRWFTQRSFRRLVESHGFEIVSMDASVANWLRRCRSFPFKVVPGRLRTPLLRALTARYPGLFGYQFLVVARLPQTGRPVATAGKSPEVRPAPS